MITSQQDLFVANNCTCCPPAAGVSPTRLTLTPIGGAPRAGRLLPRPMPLRGKLHALRRVWLAPKVFWPLPDKHRRGG